MGRMRETDSGFIQQLARNAPLSVTLKDDDGPLAVRRWRARGIWW
ncbi:hypothetical protein C5167_005736 [Papaver somniferum]|uniref:Uncharacterized protein n=1 Tax=Papaver somniferum TaxID=3469 RepID=A0A4Y7JD27_PAPSO|nr:hypothetical protein C5167_005736 [Papaver somniferum]